MMCIYIKQRVLIKTVVKRQAKVNRTNLSLLHPHVYYKSCYLMRTTGMENENKYYKFRALINYGTNFYDDF